MNSLEQRFVVFQIVFIVAGVMLAWLYATHQIITGDQTQMIYKGYMAAYKDVWVNYGNTASTVGNVPGSMMTYVVALPLMVYDSPLSPMVVIVFLHLCAYLLLDRVIKDVFSTQIRFAFLIFYWLNPWVLFEDILYNPSYLFVFAALHVWSAYKQRHEASFFYSALHVVAIGLAMQFHYSWILLAIISLYLVYKKMVRVHWFGVLFGLTLIGISLIPYIETVLQNSAIAHHEDDTGRYIGWGGVHVYPVLKSLLYWLRYASFMFPNKLIASAHFEWVEASAMVQTLLLYVYRAVVFSVGAVSLYFSYKANRYFYEQVKGKVFARDGVSDKEEWLVFYSVGAVIAVFISAVISPITFGYWHLILIFPFALVPLLIYLRDKVSSHVASKVMIGVAVYFVCINIMGAIDSRKYSIMTDYVQDTTLYVKKHVQAQP